MKAEHCLRVQVWDENSGANQRIHKTSMLVALKLESNEWLKQKNSFISKDHSEMHRFG